jgi:DNA-directed RNA polymerase subunit RPC12/RpoP
MDGRMEYKCKCGHTLEARESNQVLCPACNRYMFLAPEDLGDVGDLERDRNLCQRWEEEYDIKEYEEEGGRI